MEFDLVPKNPVKRNFVSKELPDEIIHYNILTRLPAASLVRFKCVSKDCYTLINSPTFIKIHQSYILKSDNYSSNDFMIFSNEPSLRTTYFYVHSLCGKLVENVNPARFGTDCVMGTSKGLLFIWSPSHLRFELFNPLTKERHKVMCPTSPTRANGAIRHRMCISRQGFGYDSTNRVYKIVIISIFNNNSVIPQVYNTGTCSWKTLEEVTLPMKRGFGSNGVVINNVLHWLISSVGLRDRLSILTFNLHTEKLGELAYPPQHRNYLIINGPIMELLVSNGRLHTIVGTTVSGVSLWVMKEYGVVESWVNLYNFGKEEIPFNKILTYRPNTEGGEVLLVQRVNDQNVILWYNLKNKSIRKIDTHNNKSDSVFRYEFMCNGSLAPICGSI